VRVDLPGCGPVPCRLAQEQLQRRQRGQCVEVARNLPGVVAVRDSKDPDGPSLVVRAGEWRAFIDGVRRGGFGIG